MKEESQELRQVKAEFQQWRTTKIGRQAIPQHLWEKAVSLLDKHSLACCGWNDYSAILIISNENTIP